jgi:hypothetical protein
VDVRDGSIRSESSALRQFADAMQQVGWPAKARVDEKKLVNVSTQLAQDLNVLLSGNISNARYHEMVCGFMIYRDATNRLRKDLGLAQYAWRYADRLAQGTAAAGVSFIVPQGNLATVGFGLSSSVSRSITASCRLSVPGDAPRVFKVKFSSSSEDQEQIVVWKRGHRPLGQNLAPGGPRAALPMSDYLQGARGAVIACT